MTHRKTPKRGHDAGIVLINVLMIVALMSTVVFAMVSLGDLSIARSQRFSEAAEALLLVRAGENSAVAALRRDMAEAPAADHAGEPWAQIAQEAVNIEKGSFTLHIADAQGLVNLTSLRPSAEIGAVPPDPALLPALLAAAGLSPDLAPRLRSALQQDPLFDSLAALAAFAGLTDAEATALAGVVTLLPEPTAVNLNAAPLPVLTVVTGNPAQARLLDRRRRDAGLLTPTDLAATGVLLRHPAGFTSAHFIVTTTVIIGRTSQTFVTRVYRHAPAEGASQVRIVARHRVTVPPPR